MKTKLFYLIITTLFLFTGFKLTASNINEVNKSFGNDSVEVIKEFKDFFRYDNYIIGGQPTLEALNWLKTGGVKLVINLRTDKENEQFLNTAFGEEKLLEGSGIKYISLPVSYPESYNPETLSKFADVLNNSQEKVFIHCASGVRATYFFIAYLIYFKGYSLDEAIVIGKKMKYSFPLEDILGKEIKMSLKEKKNQ